jgi:hypothetical protein
VSASDWRLVAVVVASVEVPVTTNAPVVVLLVVVRLVINAVTAFKILAKILDVVALVLKSEVAVKADDEALLSTAKPDEVMLVADAFPSVVCPDTERVDAVVVAKVVVPVTVSVPPTLWLPVIVEVPTVCVLAVKYVVVAPKVVRLVNDAVSAERSDEK